MKLILMLSVAVLLGGCDLINEIDETFNGKPGILKVKITAPVGNSAQVTVSGAGAKRVLTDDARGFETQFQVRPGSYVIDASSILGFKTLVGVTGKSGNSTTEGSATVGVKSLETTAVTVRYESQGLVEP